jgi:hypothetical protein
MSVEKATSAASTSVSGWSIVFTERSGDARLLITGSVSVGGPEWNVSWAKPPTASNHGLLQSSTAAACRGEETSQIPTWLTYRQVVTYE